ncbi:ATP-binding protein [Candidatus Lokiarchaeum ossiferum]|uniref:ATP-binding protein n=1 Tax=Candidatus Lokiarchaeum ossiferum TaxID=2951803 RepID=UPI00352CE5E4
MEITSIKAENPNEGLKIFIDLNKCIGCGMCDDVCPFGLPERNDLGKYEIFRVDLCTECSACKRNCPTQAIIMEERQGCGCLWDVKARKSGKDSCCDC